MIGLIRYAFRQLREAPGFAVTAVLTLALGIGASTAIFAVIDAVLLEPLPFARPDRLVAVAPQPDSIASVPTMQDYQARSRTFTSLAAYRRWSPAQKAADATAAHRILTVSQSFFSTLGTRFAMGGSWPMTGNEADCSSLAVVSGGYWKRLGGGGTLGKRVLNLDNRDFQIAGVLPVEQAIEGSFDLNLPEVFVQLGCDTEGKPNDRGDSDYRLIGRLRQGATIAQANADLAHTDKLLRAAYPRDYSDAEAAFSKPPLVTPYLELLVGTETKPALLMTFAACGLLLLIACANLANLLLARNTRRRGEFAIRATMGATLGQLLRQLMVESAMLVAFGATAGLLLSAGVLQAVKTSTAFHLPRLAHTSLRPAVLIFAAVLGGAVVLFLTLLPAWRTLRPGLLADMQGAGKSSAGRSLHLAGRLLVVAQLTLTVVLMACAGWMIGGVYVLLHQPLGFAPEHLLMCKRSSVRTTRPGSRPVRRSSSCSRWLPACARFRAWHPWPSRTMSLWDTPSTATIFAPTRIPSSASSR